MQCIHEERGKRCRKMISEHLPYCTAHLRTDLGLEIRNVWLETDIKYKHTAFWAKGLFATRHFEPGEMICPYNSPLGTPEDRSFGDITTKKEIDDRYGGKRDYGPYAVEEKIKGLGDITVDAACSRSVGAYANDSSDASDKPTRDQKLKTRPNNSVLICPEPVTKQIFLQATAPIDPGEEILLDYTADYWKGVHVMLTRQNGYPTSFRTYDPSAPEVPRAEAARADAAPLERSARKGRGQIDRLGDGAEQPSRPRPPPPLAASSESLKSSSESPGTKEFRLRYRRLHRKKSHKNKRKKTLDQLLNELDPPLKHPRLHRTRRKVDLDASLATPSRKSVSQLLQELEGPGL